MKLERNVSTFHGDALRHGGYVYTSMGKWSCQVATARQTDDLVRMIRRHFPAFVHITDIGCGDGTLTLELIKGLKPASMRGVDPAAAAIEVAVGRTLNTAIPVSFDIGSIYDIENRQSGSEMLSLAVLRGVLHHLDNPRAAIARLATQFKSVVALEPNGYNPMMKAIERLSPYHRAHDEKSYWPPALNRWFEEFGYVVVDQRFFCLVPYFCPTPMAQFLKVIEPVVEKLPLLRQIACGTNLTLYEMKSK